MVAAAGVVPLEVVLQLAVEQPHVGDDTAVERGSVELLEQRALDAFTDAVLVRGPWWGLVDVDAARGGTGPEAGLSFWAAVDDHAAEHDADLVEPVD